MHVDQERPTKHQGLTKTNPITPHSEAANTTLQMLHRPEVRDTLGL